ncbi:ROK family protein [Alkaliphilus serpentinus]|uniref:Glucokinase n=1 Tax=Alkaliphilus serpentinus TaxID=1482731 RepID=A0A833HPS2_9FIRM|nr:ROK family protein [Alkaliphilus serpentinus]KAB3531113.1 ROK family protein [Alkaliphilus serpentinus]
MYYIGVDVGGTTIKVGLVSEDGRILHSSRGRTPVKEGCDEIVNKIQSLINEVIEGYGAVKGDVKAIGLGIPGVANKEGFVYFATNLFMKDFPLGKNLENATGIKVFIENDATVAAVAEYVKGASSGTQNSIFLTLGTGLGGGLIIDGKVYSGSHGIGTEMGHMVIGENFYDCNCGNNGCWETFSSATAMIKYCQRLLEEDQRSLVYNKVEGDLKEISAKLIFDCYQEGDSIAKEVVERMVQYLAKGIGNLINIFDPEVIVLGGGVAGGGHLFLDMLKEEIQKYIYLKSMNLTEIALAQLGNDAGIIGGSMYAKLRLEESGV